MSRNCQRRKKRLISYKAAATKRLATLSGGFVRNVILQCSVDLISKTTNEQVFKHALVPIEKSEESLVGTETDALAVLRAIDCSGYYLFFFN